MKTQCQKLGYKVGDKFEIIQENTAGFHVGTIVRLCKDDGTDMPLFSGDNSLFRNAYGEEGAFTRLENVRPIGPKKAKRPWIKWEGGECPVPEGTLVDVKYGDGLKQKGCPVGRTPAEFERNAFFKPNLDPAYDIVAYRLAKPKKAAEPAQAAQAEPTVQREANGRPVGAKAGDWFRVIVEPSDRPYNLGDVVQLTQDDATGCPFFMLGADKVSIHWDRLEPCPAPSQPEPEPAKPEWEILWGSAKDFEGAPDWAVYVSPAGSFLEDVIRGARLSYGDGVEDIVCGVANCRPKAARRLKQPK